MSTCSPLRRYYSFNLGQYFTLWDRIGGTYREPSPFLGVGPHDDVDAIMKGGKGAKPQPKGEKGGKGGKGATKDKSA